MRRRSATMRTLSRFGRSVLRVTSSVIVTIPWQGRGEHRPSGQQPRARQQSLSQLK